MPALASITIADHSAQNVVFTPVSLDAQGVAKYLTSDSQYESKKSITFSFSQPKPGSPVLRGRMKVMIPITEVTTDNSGNIIPGSLTKVGENVVTLDVVFSKKATQLQRQDLITFAKNLLATSLVTAMTDNLETVY